ncbi:MAG TPA: DedA family protein [Actinomycetes bacterium]|jgi:membrane protein DedA with SNARE-associated domain|nr:DedA family protein [Actinomycetes bacterium]
MEHLITDYVLHYGYLAVFVLMVLESACVPVPSEVTMLFGGALANGAFLTSLGQDAGPLNFVVVALVGAFGNLVGSWIAWAVGYRGGRPLIERWGRYVFLREHELERAELWFERHGQAAVLVSRLLPVVRTFISLPAGIAEMRFARFSVYTFIGCLPWTFALTAVGYALGGQWEVVERYLRPVSYGVAALVLVAAAWWFGRRWSEQRGRTRGVNVTHGAHERSARPAASRDDDAARDRRTSAPRG